MAVRRCGAAAAVECFEASDDRSKETEILLVTAAATSHANKSVIRDKRGLGRARIQATYIDIAVSMGHFNTKILPSLHSKYASV